MTRLVMVSGKKTDTPAVQAILKGYTNLEVSAEYARQVRTLPPPGVVSRAARPRNLLTHPP